MFSCSIFDLFCDALWSEISLSGLRENAVHMMKSNVVGDIKCHLGIFQESEMLFLPSYKSWGGGIVSPHRFSTIYFPTELSNPKVSFGYTSSVLQMIYVIHVCIIIDKD